MTSGPLQKMSIVKKVVKLFETCGTLSHRVLLFSHKSHTYQDITFIWYYLYQERQNVLNSSQVVDFLQGIDA